MRKKYDVFTIPGLRYSRDKCDWCPELIERGQIMQDTVQVVDKYVAEKFVSGDVNAQAPWQKTLFHVTLDRKIV